MNYTHLSQEERYQIHALRRCKITLTRIAAELGRSTATISRELGRNSSLRGYKPAHAHALAVARQSDRRNAIEFSRQEMALVERYLRLGLSPGQVAGRLHEEALLRISTETIYQYIYQNKAAGGDLVSYLRCQKARKKRYASGQERRGQIKGRVCIGQRPAIVQAKSRIGDWEGDTVIGKDHCGALVTLVERRSRYTLAARLDCRHSSAVTEAIVGLLKPHQRQCHTITFDNGKEFAQHSLMAARLKASIYFAHPYCSWERGLNENTNGLLRQYFPKASNFLKVSSEQLEHAVHRLNHRPRKCLNYRTPHEVFFGIPMRPITLSYVTLCA